MHFELQMEFGDMSSFLYLVKNVRGYTVTFISYLFTHTHTHANTHKIILFFCLKIRSEG